MKRIVFQSGLLLMGLLVNTCGLSAVGQQSAISTSVDKGPELKPSPQKTLQDFEPAADEPYELGPGDEISLDFPGRAELSGKKIVGPDGRITLAVAGPVLVADKTRTEAAKAIIDALAAYYQNLTVTVNIDKYGSNRIVLIGNVQHPGVLYFDTTPTLLDVVARGGLLANQGGTGSGSAVRDGIPNRCAIYRGNDKVLWVDLKVLLQSGSATADLRLRRNDIVFIPLEQEQFVSVLGQVNHPGAIALTPQTTLASILAQSGGLNEGASSKIQVIDPTTGKTTVVSFKSILTPKGTNEVTLHAGDVIFVPTSGFYKTTYVIQRVTPGATLGMAAAIAQ